MKSIYIHIPFCKQKCLYCDFNSFDNKENLIEKYFEALIKEIKSYKINNELKTIYIGGGTPSSLTLSELEKLFSIIKIFNPEELVINYITYIILVIAIIGKSLQMLVYLDFSKAINSNTLKTNAIDTRNDIISTTAILISMIIMGIFKINIDGILGLAVSGFVILSSINMIKEVLEPIIGIIPSEERTNEITKELLSYEFVEGIHDLVIHNYGVHNDFVTVHVEFDSKMDVIKAHDLMDNIEKDLLK